MRCNATRALQEDRASKAKASASKEESQPADAPSSDLLYIDAPWNKKAAVAAAAVGGGGGSGDWYKPKPNLQPASKAAPWNQKGYFPASRLIDCERPHRGEALSNNMPERCPEFPYSQEHNYNSRNSAGASTRPCATTENFLSMNAVTQGSETFVTFLAARATGSSAAPFGRMCSRASTSRTKIASRRYRRRALVA